jgi:hypothetical protein
MSNHDLTDEELDALFIREAEDYLASAAWEVSNPDQVPEDIRHILAESAERMEA